MGTPTLFPTHFPSSNGFTRRDLLAMVEGTCSRYSCAPSHRPTFQHPYTNPLLGRLSEHQSPAKPHRKRQSSTVRQLIQRLSNNPVVVSSENTRVAPGAHITGRHGQLHDWTLPIVCCSLQTKMSATILWMENQDG